MKYFLLEDFASPDLKGSGKEMNTYLLGMLDAARAKAMIPFIINSGYRTVGHNKEVKGSPTSSHLKGLAADIHCVDGVSRLKMVRALLSVGFRRIGIAKTFIHVDIDSEKPDAIWIY